MEPCDNCPDTDDCGLRHNLIRRYGDDALEDSRCAFKPVELWTAEEHEINLLAE